MFRASSASAGASVPTGGVTVFEAIDRSIRPDQELPLDFMNTQIAVRAIWNPR